MTLADLEFLTSPEADQALQELAGADLGRELERLTQLRRRFSSQQAAALFELARLRKRAASSWKEAHRLFFVADALEQSTSAPLAAHRAHQLHQRAGPGTVLDLGCGLGADTLALARRRPMIAYEKDPLRAALARLNLGTLGVEAQVREGDWRAEVLPESAAMFVDPGRRSGGRRRFSLEQLDPPFSELPRGVPLCVKVMPGVSDEELPQGAEVEFVSHQRVCKEAVLWLGDLCQRPGRRASVLTAGGWKALEAHGLPAPLGPLEAGMDLHEPDPAVIRAGAVAELAPELGAHLFDPQIAYLVGPAGPTSELAQSFHILEVERFSLKRLKASLARWDLRPDEIKKRGSPIEPEELRLLLPHKGSRRGVVVLTRQGDQRLFLLAERPPKG